MQAAAAACSAAGQPTFCGHCFPNNPATAYTHRQGAQRGHGPNGGSLCRNADLDAGRLAGWLPTCLPACLPGMLARRTVRWSSAHGAPLPLPPLLPPCCRWRLLAARQLPCPAGLQSPSLPPHHTAWVPIQFFMQLDSLCSKATCPIKKGPTEVRGCRQHHALGSSTPAFLAGNRPAARPCAPVRSGSHPTRPARFPLSFFVHPGEVHAAVPDDHPARLLLGHPQRPRRRRTAVLRDRGLPGTPAVFLPGSFHAHVHGFSCVMHMEVGLQAAAFCSPTLR